MLSSLINTTGLSALVLRVIAYLLVVIAIAGTGYYYGSSRTADRYEAIAAKLEQIRQKAETEQLRKNEIDQRNASERIAQKERELFNAKINQNRSADALRNLLASLPNPANDASRSSGTKDAADQTGVTGTCEPALELFTRTAAHAGKLAVRADELALQVAGLQAYGQACYELTNPK
jgi:hypothetical protein